LPALQTFGLPIRAVKPSPILNVRRNKNKKIKRTVCIDIKTIKCYFHIWINMIEERLKEKIISGMYITTRSTPVIWFGNYCKSQICTISLNPSDKEFYKQPKGVEDYVKIENLLKDKEERLCSRYKLNKNDNEQLNDDDIIIVKDYCNNYFQNRNYYKEWFDPFNDFLKEYGDYSYFDGSCVNLDIIQWATTPKWSGLSEDIREKHLNKDIHFLKYLLNNKDFKIIFLNGKSVVDTISEKFKLKLDEKKISYKNNKGKDKIIKIYLGKYNEAKVIGWNLYFQYTFKNIENIKIFSELIKKNT